MIGERDVQGLLDLWLGEGPEEVPDVVVEQALVTIDSTNQVRAPFGRSWRGITMPKFAPVAIGTAVVLLVAVLGVGFLGGGNNTAPGNPPASPSPSASAHAGAASPSPTATSPAVGSTAPTSSNAAGPIDTGDWLAYTSDRYGFDLSYPKAFTARPSTRDWTMDRRSGQRPDERGRRFFGRGLFDLSLGLRGEDPSRHVGRSLADGVPAADRWLRCEPKRERDGGRASGDDQSHLPGVARVRVHRRPGVRLRRLGTESGSAAQGHALDCPFPPTP